MIELDLEVHLEAIEGLELRPLVAVLDAQALLDADETLRPPLLLDARRLQQEDERPRAAIHDRHLGSGQLDDGVVDPKSRKRREQVFDGRDTGVAAPECGAERRVTDIVRCRANVDRLCEVGAPEDDARVRIGRLERHQHLFAGVEAYTGGADRVLQGALTDHAYSFTNGPAASRMTNAPGE